MTDTNITKVSSESASAGSDGQVHLAAGQHVAMRMWRDEQPHEKSSSRRDYETVGFVVSGRAELTIEGKTTLLKAGDSWLVPRNAAHSYKILESFTSVEATSPPA